MKKKQLEKNKLQTIKTLVYNEEKNICTSSNVLNLKSIYLNRYYTHYKNTISSDLILKQNLKNIFEIPKLEKIILNTSSKNIASDRKNIIINLLSLELISGKKPKWTRAHKSVSNFKLRENQIIGCKLDLKHNDMFTFLEKLVTVILPRTVYFKGSTISCLNKSGNYSLGLQEISFFPELESYFEYFQNTKGVDITLVFNKNKNWKNSSLISLALLSRFQFPIK